jgi:rod shape-determining protein MreD
MLEIVWPGPDLILALVMAWGLRRPDYLPALLVGLALLLADLILQRPPGLWAALVVLALELLRARNHLWRDLPFLAEWAVISAVMTAVVVAYWLVLSLLFVRHATIGLYLIQLIGTIVIYPLVVLTSTRVLGVRSPAPGTFAGLGGRQ